MRKGMSKVLMALLLIGTILTVMPGVKAEAKAKLSKTKATIYTGEKLKLKLRETTGKVTWRSDKKGIATVNKNGVVTGKKEGSCVIKAKCKGKNYSCKLTVKTLPKNYATINGKKVKVGSKVKITYMLASDSLVDDVSVCYSFYENELKVVTSSDHKMRFKTWACIKEAESKNSPVEDKDINRPHKKEKKYFSYQCWGINPKNPYSTSPYSVSCKQGKEFDSFYVKALHHGNFTFKAKFDVMHKNKHVKYTVTEKIK